MLRFPFPFFRSTKLYTVLLSINLTAIIAKKDFKTPSPTNSEKITLHDEQDTDYFYHQLKVKIKLKIKETVKKIIENNKETLYISELSIPLALRIVKYIDALKSPRHQKKASYHLDKICNEVFELDKLDNPDKKTKLLKLLELLELFAVLRMDKLDKLDDKLNALNQLLEDKKLKDPKNIKEGKVVLILLQHLGMDRSYEIVKFTVEKVKSNKKRPIVYFKEQGLHYRRNTKTYKEADITWGTFDKLALKTNAQKVKIGEIIKPQGSILDWLLANPKTCLVAIASLIFSRDILQEKAKLQEEKEKLQEENQNLGQTILTLQQGGQTSQSQKKSQEKITRKLFRPTDSVLASSVKRQPAGQGLYNFGTTCYINSVFQNLRGLYPNGELFDIKKEALAGLTLAARDIYEVFYDICHKINNHAESIPNSLLYRFFLVLSQHKVFTHVGDHEDPSEVLIKIMGVFGLNFFQYKWVKSNVNFAIESKGDLEALKNTILQQDIGGTSDGKGGLLRIKVSENTDEKKVLNVQDFINNYTHEEEAEVACSLDEYIQEVHNKTMTKEQELQIKKVLAIQLINKHDGFPKSWGDAIPEQYRNTTREDLLKKSKKDWHGLEKSCIKYKFTEHAQGRPRKADGNYQAIPSEFPRFMESYLFVKKNQLEEKDFSEDLDKKLKDLLVSIVQDEKEVEDIIKSLKVSEDNKFNLLINYTYTKQAQDLQVAGDKAIIHLARFRGLTYKLTNPIENAERITIGDKEFELAAFIRHRGKALAGGHYTADVKEDNQWKFYDDSRVENIGSEILQNHLQGEDYGPYMLFYKQIEQEVENQDP